MPEEYFQLTLFLCSLLNFFFFLEFLLLIAIISLQKLGKNQNREILP